jgi:hypothetical protein
MSSNLHLSNWVAPKLILTTILSKSCDAANRDFVPQQLRRWFVYWTQRRISSFFADEALVRIREAWYVLSDPIRLYQFEREIREEGNGFSSASFWTMCPYCWYLVSVRESMKIKHVGGGNCKRFMYLVEYERDL